MNTNKALQDLTIKDGFMFFALMSDCELCRELLELILDIQIEEVIVHPEDSLMYHPKFHGVRLDVIAIEQGTRRKFNVEMQAEKRDSLPRRSRYYHSQIDMDLLTKGANYDELSDTYVIFICDFDPFGYGLYRYRFQMQCMENGSRLDDGIQTVFLNAHGSIKSADISDRLIAFLEYVAKPERGNRIDDAFVNKIDTRVQSIRFNREWEAQYMLLRETLREERELAKAEGLIEGRAEGLAEGRAEGRAEGEIRILIKLVLSKVKAQESIQSLLEEISEESELISKIHKVVLESNENANEDQIYKELMK